MPKFPLPLLNSLPAFEAAARLQSVKKASGELHVSRAAVSQHIRRLEKAIGRELFRRAHRRIVLNDDGRLLLGAVSVGLTSIRRAFAQLSVGKGPERLVICVDPDFAGLWLVPRLAGFYGIVPNTLVEILAQKTPPSLFDPGIGCAIQYAAAGLAVKNGEMLFRSRLSPVCAESLASRLRSPDDLRHHVLLHDRNTHEWRQYFRSCRVMIPMDVKSGIVFSETALCLDAAARGQGVAIGDDCLAAMHLAEGRLVRPFATALLSKNAYYFVAPAAARRTASVSAFRTWLLRNIERERADMRAP